METQNTKPVSQNPPIETGASRVACDGGEGALGHPKIYLEFADQTDVSCPYCGQTFIRKAAV